eukprot:6188740-Pleurochrysis_carterae.AAC.1
MSHFREVDRLPLYCVTERHAFTRRAVTHTRIQESVCARMPHARTCAPTRVRAHARAHARTRTYTREAHTNALRGLSQSALKRHSERRVRRNNIDRAICVARARSISRGHLAALQCRSTAIIRFVSSAAIELDPTDKVAIFAAFLRSGAALCGCAEAAVSNSGRCVSLGLRQRARAFSCDGRPGPGGIWDECE